jgi:hypothetical protein
MAVVLVQFAVLSFCAVPLVTFPDLVLTASFWWGVCSAFGACGLLFRKFIKNWYLGAVMSDVAAVVAFITLSYDYLTRMPPIIAGSVLSATAAIFLIGGLIYERRAIEPQG